MSDDRKTLRYSLLPSMMMIYDYNSKRNNKDVCIFEIAKSFLFFNEYLHNSCKCRIIKYNMQMKGAFFEALLAKISLYS